MHAAATVFLLSLFAGALSTPAHRASLRLRRADDAFVRTSELLSRAEAELPPLPLEFEEQEEEIYMSIDDPRVGTVDEEGNVLVPVDEDGRILPGFEHLIRPFQESDLNSPEPTRKDDDRTSGTEQDASVSSSIDVDSSYDENAINPNAAHLPAAKDYVDSREADIKEDRDQKNMEAVKPDLTGLEGVFQEDESVGKAPEGETKSEEKVDQLVNEILALSRSDIIDEKIPDGEGEEEGASNPQSIATDESKTDSLDEEPSKNGDDEAEERPNAVADPEDDGKEDDAQPPIGQGIREIERTLPVDDDKDYTDPTSFRKEDLLGHKVSPRTRHNPNSAALSSTLVSLIFTVIWCVCRM
ncbi:hypothetical protein GCK32_004246 [Trichostrongylus colubriformis]|uniref:Uncharacterized protein n=1 Tax=Trichostrongylus colubriformis TaxID=6319 RepID=A0AAN8FV83_TRICO